MLIDISHMREGLIFINGCRDQSAQWQQGGVCAGMTVCVCACVCIKVHLMCCVTKLKDEHTPRCESVFVTESARQQCRAETQSDSR